MIVVDASVLANAVGDSGPEGAAARHLLSTAQTTAVPDLAYSETMSVLRRRWLAGDLDEPLFSAAVEDLSDLPLERHSSVVALQRCFELKANVTAYDACYIALAELLGCELVTGDGRLSRAPGLRCPVRVVTRS